MPCAHLEALVLQHALDGCIFTTGRQLCLEDDAERAVSDNLALCVCQVLVVARQAVLHLFADNFWRAVSDGQQAAGRGGLLTTHS